jgi:uncharacterized protein involved in exopolysaccharide biosynthesis
MEGWFFHALIPAPLPKLNPTIRHVQQRFHAIFWRMKTNPSNAGLKFGSNQRQSMNRQSYRGAGFGLMVLAGLLVAGGVAYHALTKPIFKATAIFKLEESTFLPPPPNQDSFSHPYWTTTEYEIIQSSVILDQVTKNLQLDHAWAGKIDGQAPLRNDEIRLMLRRRLDIQERGKGKLIAIQMDSEDPNEAAAIANEIFKVYHDYRAKEDREFMESARYRERIEAYRKTYAARGDPSNGTGKPALVEMVKPATPPLQPGRPSKAVTGGLIVSSVLVGLIGFLLGTRKMY